METKTVTRKELTGYASFGAILALGMVPLQFLNIFLTEDLKITAGTLGTILLAARVIDFLISFSVGGIIESANFRSGKYTPWLGLPRFIIYTGLILSFLPLPLPLFVRAILVIVAYLMVNTTQSFVTTVQYGVLSLLSGPSIDNRNRLAIAAVRLTTVATVLTASTSAPVRNAVAGIVGSTRSAYIIIAAAYGLFYIAALSMLSRVAKPYDQPNDPSRAAARPKITVKDMIRCVVTNKQLIIYLISGTLYFIGLFSPLQMVAYYYIYILHDPKLLLMAAATTITTLFSLVSTMIGPKIGLRLGRKKARFTGQFLAGISAVCIIFFAAHHVAVYIAIMCFSGLSAALYSGFGVSYIIDCGEYGYWKTGIDNRIVTNSLMNIPMKVSQFVGGSLGLYGLALIGWKTGMEVTPEFTRKFMLLLGGLPAVCYFCASFMTLFLYKIDDREAALYARENAERAKARAAGQEAAT
ncbi:MAG: MFS transporter [Spirochaetaceae bacterium]|jgi:Na+/melibiose symporter-like transporter|nr:MFS transporter [Spirochaetaceae bacterium]